MVALLSLEHSTTIIWGDQDSDAESVDADAGDSDRLLTFEVAETNKQKENAFARPGFQVLSHSSFSCHVSEPSKMDLCYIMPSECPPGCPVDPTILASPSAWGDYTRTLDYVLHPASNSFRGFRRTHLQPGVSQAVIVGTPKLLWSLRLTFIAEWTMPSSCRKNLKRTLCKR